MLAGLRQPGPCSHWHVIDTRASRVIPGPASRPAAEWFTFGRPVSAGDVLKCESLFPQGSLPLTKAQCLSQQGGLVWLQALWEVSSAGLPSPANTFRGSLVVAVSVPASEGKRTGLARVFGAREGGQQKLVRGWGRGRGSCSQTPASPAMSRLPTVRVHTMVIAGLARSGGGRTCLR